MRLLELRVEGVTHNVLNVMLLLGIPISIIGLLALPWQVRDRALRPLVIVGAVTFLATSLLFPVATTWGTFLHAAAPVHVLLVVSALGGLDALIAWVGAKRGWTRPVAWLGALLAVFGSILFSAVMLPPTGRDGGVTARRYEVLARQLAAAGIQIDGTTPVLSDQPLWMAETLRVPTLALPDEPPSDVLDLAQDPRFNAGLLVIAGGDHGSWPDALLGGDPAAACFREVPLPLPPDPADAAAIEGVRVFRIGCATGIDGGEGVEAGRRP